MLQLLNLPSYIEAIHTDIRAIHTTDIRVIHTDIELIHTDIELQNLVKVNIGLAIYY